MAWTTQTPPTDAVTVLNAAYMNAFEANLLSLRNGNDHYVRLYLSGNPSIANNTNTAVSWTDEAFPQVGTIWSAANPSRLTAPVTGKYLVLATAEWRTNTANLRSINITRSAGGSGQYDLQSQGASGGRSICNAKLIVSLTAAQFLTVRVFQSSGGALTLHGGAPDRTRVSVLFLGV